MSSIHRPYMAGGCHGYYIIKTNFHSCIEIHILSNLYYNLICFNSFCGFRNAVFFKLKYCLNTSNNG